MRAGQQSTNRKLQSIRIDAQTVDVETVGVIVGAVVGVPRTLRVNGEAGHCPQTPSSAGPAQCDLRSTEARGHRVDK